MKTIMNILLISFSLFLTIISSSHVFSKEDIQKSFDIGAKFTASGWMGDGKFGQRFIQLVEGWRGNPHSAPTCIKVAYNAGPEGWGGIYWQNKANNWGDWPGENFSKSGYKKITFWARGERGGELVEFKAGGIIPSDKKYRDSFEASIGKVHLETTWQKYAIDLKNSDLSSVIGGFCWVASKSGNPEGLIFYIDDIFYEY